nr:uncharacterized protein LOC113709084 [Coffea arabica]
MNRRNLEERSGLVGSKSPPTDECLLRSSSTARRTKSRSSSCCCCCRRRKSYCLSSASSWGCSINDDNNHDNTNAVRTAKITAAAGGGERLNNGGGSEVNEWPRIYIPLSRKEKEEDFLAMKGTKLPHRPKKRPKTIDRILQYCFPGMWLSDLTRGRYEVREKKCPRKQKRRGLKGMESLESDSE